MSKSLDIVGGVYGEHCAFPRDSTVRGSGGRAALIAKSLGANVRLHYVAGEGTSQRYLAIAEPRGIECIPFARGGDVHFYYAHPLSRPEISIGSEVVELDAAIDADSALIYGTIEKSVVVHTNLAVYDPQDGQRSVLFGSDGSTARKVVYVVNEVEACSLTGTSDRAEAIERLTSERNVECVIIKLGVEGALVASGGDRVLVPPCPTKSVWKIGSGDVFSAAFAVAWAIEGRDPISAACLASRTVAEYVQTRADFMLPSVMDGIRSEAKELTTRAWLENGNVRSMRKVYLAAPFFSTSQRWFVDEIKAIIEGMGIVVFSPIHDVGEGDAKRVAEADLEGLSSCDAVFAVVDGSDLGTVFEIGYARATGKSVIVLAEQLPEPQLTMLYGSDIAVYKDLTSAIYNLAWLCQSIQE